MATARKHPIRLEGKTVLVTGAGGFLGRVLVEKLRSAGCRVTGVDRTAGFDVCDCSCFAKLRGRRWDLVYHLAGAMHVPTSWKHPRETFATNLLGTLNVLDFCRAKKAGRLVFASSAMYGIPHYLPIDERHPVEATNPYSWSKATAEELCRAYGKLFGLDITILRPFNVYGPGQRRDFLVASVVSQVKNSGRVKVHDIAPRRDYLHVDDMAEAFLRAGTGRRKSGVRVFNVGSGRSHSVEEVVDAAFRSAGKPRRLSVSGRKRRGDVPDVVADISAARRELRWKPQTSFVDGIAAMLS